MHPLPRVNEIRSAHISSINSTYCFLLHLSHCTFGEKYYKELQKVLLYHPKKVSIAWIAILFFLQRGGGHRPKGSLLPSGRKRHVYPDGPAGHCSGQIDACAAAHTAAAQAILRLCMLQLLSGTVCVTPAFHVCGPSSSFKMSLLCLVTSNAIPL